MYIPPFATQLDKLGVGAKRCAPRNETQKSKANAPFLISKGSSTILQYKTPH